jgi:hypothetical protein
MKPQFSGGMVAYACALALLTGVATRDASAQTSPATAPAAQTSDSIVRLARDPGTQTGAPWVILLDELELRVEPDGRNTERHRTVVQLLTDAGARNKAEQSFGYAPGHQGFTLDWVRVLKPNGVVISDKPALEQDADVPVAMQNPVYQDQKIRRLSLAGVAAGTILDLAWTVDEKAPYRPGDFYDRWYMNSVADVVRSRFVLNTPETFQPRIVERNLNFRRRDSTSAGRRITTWAAGPMSRVSNEAFAADSNDVIMSITVAPTSSWSDVAQWYHGLSKDRYALSPSIAARVDSVVRASRARTHVDTLRALHRWVAQDIRYVSVALGIAGYQPRTPAAVLETGFGDCKDKATLFVAAARHFKLDVNPVLLSSAVPPDRNTPSIYQFNHEIAAIREGKSWTYTDLTAEAVPYGTLPPSYQGFTGVIVLPDGRGEEITFPLAPPDSNSSVVRLNGEVNAAGALSATVEDRQTNALALPNRQAFYAPMDSARRAGALRAIGAAYYRDGIADSLTTFDGHDLQADARVVFRIATAEAFRSAGNVKLLTVPASFRGPAQPFAALARNLAAAPPRKFNIDAARVLGPVTIVTDLQLTLPGGWVAELPKNVLATSFAGRYETTYSQEGRVLHIARRVTGARGIFPPQRIVEVIEWLKAIAADDNEFIQLKPTP